ncbi:major facilitator transporter [Scytonema sp. HK-05]|uniref:MFS transporter n=1 Tax=Scytonema sp. HK-05 TaxID=1137095 RepID=UPI000935EBB2|nr:MFS transporter [Scytonema sp. HK-05]OKH57853.1 MFS transporter [Scytonema sp. HK-05]BAY49078.1 major facilitator transporter [Scytonema sp. HK-05]
MFRQSEDDLLVETSPLPIQEIAEDRAITETLLPPTPKLLFKISKPEIRTSLRALTFESVFATVFYSIIGSALLTNFLLELGAGPVEIGLLASIPQLVNLLQPLGAYLVDRSPSFNWYSMCIFVPSRLLWVILVPAIWFVTSVTSNITGDQVVLLTLGIILVTNIIEALGRAPFLGWTAVLVPQRLRGRYFGFRNSLVSLTNLIGVPLLGLAVSTWPGGTLQGYGVVLVLGIVFGLSSLVSQFWLTDVNPQLLKVAHSETSQVQSGGIDLSFLKDANFLKFVFYIAIWCFAVNVSAPFFNLYMLDNLEINISVVTIYTGISTGANMLLLLLWGKLADRIGNRPLLVFVGFLVGVTPLFWLGTGADPISLWVWLPLLHVLTGGTWAAIDLCTNNLMMAVAPLGNQSKYFAITGAVAGVSGAIGITAGSFLATQAGGGGLLGLFVLSAVLRVVALLPLLFVQEERSVPLAQLMRVLFPVRQPTELIEAEK